MHQNSSFSNNMDTLFSDLKNLTGTKTVLGDPLSVGNKTLVPVMSVTVGYGSAAGLNKQSDAADSPMGLGLGAKISTNAVVIIDNESVSMLPVNEKGSNLDMSQLMDKIPQTLANIGQSLKQQGMQGQGGQQQGQMQNMMQGIMQNQQSNQQNNQAQNTRKKQ